MGLTENSASGPLALNGLGVRPESAFSMEDTEVGLADSGQRLAVLVPSGSRVHSGFEGESSAAGGRTLVLGPKNAANLEALRTAAVLDPELFREIYDFSRTRYVEDRASYHVSASLERAVQTGDVPDEELPALLELFDEREILHVTFVSVLKEVSRKS